MQTKVKEYRNGWSALIEQLPNGMFGAHVRRASGELHDKVRCDDRRDASAYFRAFCAIARNGGN